MKEIIKNIIENYFDKNKILSYNLINNDSLLIIKDKEWNEADFFYFIFDNELKEFDSNKIYNELIKKNEGLLKIESFEKNLNFIIFSKVDVYEDMYNNEISDNAYIIEEDPFNAKKKVIFYTDSLVDNFIDLDVKNIEKVDKDMNKNDKFKINLLIWLSFIKVDFWNRDLTKKNIFHETYEDFKKYIENDEMKILENDILINEDFNSFNSKIEEIDYNSILSDIEKNPLWLSSFEEILLNLFENRDELEEKLNINLLELQKLEHENKENWNI